MVKKRTHITYLVYDNDVFVGGAKTLREAATLLGISIMSVSYICNGHTTVYDGRYSVTQIRDNKV